MAEYRIGGRAKECAATGKPFESGQVVISAIYEDPEAGFVRRDYSEEGFEGAEGAFSHWRSRLPETQEDANKLDVDLAQGFLEKLIREADPAREGLAYTLTLLLSRKRRIKITRTRQLPQGELLTVLLRGAEQDTEVRVNAPRLTAEDVTALQGELARLFGFEPPAEEAATT